MSTIEQLRAKLHFLSKTVGTKTKMILVENIPKVLSKFLNSDALWQSIETPIPDTTSCFFTVPKGYKIDKHKHEESEQLIIVNKTGKLKVFTEKKNFILQYPESCFFEKNEEHYIEFLEQTDLVIFWHPKIENWKAEF